MFSTQALSQDAGLAIRARPGKRVESGEMRPGFFLGLLGNRVRARLNCALLELGPAGRVLHCSWACVALNLTVAFPAPPLLQPRAPINS